MNEREFLARKLYSAHERMDSVYAAISAGECRMGTGAYSAAVRRLHSAEQAAWNAGINPSHLCVWNSELQGWRVAL